MLKKVYQAKEAELCSRLAEVLRADGWECFHSVRFAGYELDLCGVKVSETGETTTLAIEARRLLDFEVIGKSLFWLGYSSFVAIAVDGLPRETGPWWACGRAHHRNGIGLYSDAKPVHIPRASAATKGDVLALAMEARKSSQGLLINGGSKSPRVARKPDLLAEQVAKAMESKPFGEHSLHEMLPNEAELEIIHVAAILNGKRGRGLNLRARRFGTDYLVSRKY